MSVVAVIGFSGRTSRPNVAFCFFCEKFLNFYAQNIHHATRKLSTMTKKNLGLGATCSACHCFVHPASVVKQKFPNARKKEPLTGLVCLRKETKKVHNNDQECAVFRHEDFAMEDNWMHLQNKDILQMLSGSLDVRLLLRKSSFVDDGDPK
jgi:hypothetical protein